MLGWVSSAAPLRNPQSLAGVFSFGMGPAMQCRFKINKRKSFKTQKMRKFPRIAVILREDVPRLGVQGQEVLVKRGHARNNLLLKKDRETPIAVYATPESRKAYKTVHDDGYEGENTSARLSSKLEQDLHLNLGNRRVPFYAEPSEDDITVTATPVTLAQIYHSFLSRGFSFLFYEQLKLEHATPTISKFGSYTVSVDLSAGPVPLGSSTVAVTVDLRLRHAKGLSSRMLAQRAQDAEEQADEEQEQQGEEQEGEEEQEDEEPPGEEQADEAEEQEEQKSN
jgi:ribosomal protein L9